MKVEFQMVAIASNFFRTVMRKEMDLDFVVVPGMELEPFLGCSPMEVRNVLISGDGLLTARLCPMRLYRDEAKSVLAKLEEAGWKFSQRADLGPPDSEHGGESPGREERR